MISKNKAKRSTVMNASLVLKAARPCGWTNEAIAAACAVSTNKVAPRKQRVVEEGLVATLSRKPVTNAHRRHITGDEEAHGVAVCCRQAPAGQARWP